jgi:capsule polysaccharide export protein KpsE/RkpR
MDSNNQNNLTDEIKNDVNFHLLDLLSSLWKWRKKIITLSAIITLGTLLVSFFIPNYYTASCIFVPSNEERDLFANEGKNNSIYGDEDAVDRGIIIAKSTPLIDFMVKEFDLSKRYGIDASTPKGQDRVSRRFLKLFKLKKNDHGGIELTLQDTDPVMASKMLSAALNRIDALYKQATASNKDQMMKTYEDAISSKRNELKTIGDSLFVLRKKYSVFDVEKQGEVLSELIIETESQLTENIAKLESFKATGGRPDSIINLTARVKGYTKKLEIINNKSDSVNGSINLNAYNEAREAILFYDSQTKSINEDIGEIIKEYSRFKAQATSKASTIIILEPVQIPRIKSYPVRSLMTLAALIASIFISIVGVLIIDLNIKVDWKSIFGK